MNTSADKIRHCVLLFGFDGVTRTQAEIVQVQFAYSAADKGGHRQNQVKLHDKLKERT